MSRNAKPDNIIDAFMYIAKRCLTPTEQNQLAAALTDPRFTNPVPVSPIPPPAGRGRGGNVGGGAGRGGEQPLRVRGDQRQQQPQQRQQQQAPVQQAGGRKRGGGGGANIVPPAPANQRGGRP
eukprot:CAMPEP_0174862738 /NCGR_PEP_ID=MMETSP1114-20130205/54765_1 /TAXON_ID=312471 /ORGANISM="Neobodo designis, Strain CCAP 1951/1" /LENGTH=122 /DNA_ID=CAMNT_0016097793 /DNA_START=53 /DNA_END=417 /DNA_ORIENTATION=+